MNAFVVFHHVPLHNILAQYQVWAEEFGDLVDVSKGETEITKIYMTLMMSDYANMFLKDLYHPEVACEWITWLQRTCGYEDWDVQAFYISLLHCLAFPVEICDRVDMLDAIDDDSDTS